MPGNLRPLVYSCSGCSGAAQMANAFAIRLDRDAAAEMSCIAGVGGGVTGLLRTARSGRRILALDGCVLKCVAACLANAGVIADAHLVLSDHGVRKRPHAEFDPVQAADVYAQAVLPAALALQAAAVDAGGGGSPRAVAGASTGAIDAD